MRLGGYLMLLLVVGCVACGRRESEKVEKRVFHGYGESRRCVIIPWSLQLTYEDTGLYNSGPFGRDTNFNGHVMKMLDSLRTDYYNVDEDGYVLNTYKGMPFKAGDTISQNISFYIGKIPVRGSAKFVLKESDGLFYDLRKNYRIEVLEIVIDKKKSGNLPADLIKALINTQDDVEELSAEEIEDSLFQPSLRIVWNVEDFNMDGIPDFGIGYDIGFHSNEHTYAVWINIKGRLIMWHKVLGCLIHMYDTTKREMKINNFHNDEWNDYKVIHDTTLVPTIIKDDI